jgi:hypothetical protein
VHEALSSALALASRQIADESSPLRIVSPIDTRRSLGLGEDCAVLIDAGVVAIEPHKDIDVRVRAIKSPIRLLGRQKPATS